MAYVQPTHVSAFQLPVEPAESAGAPDADSGAAPDAALFAADPFAAFASSNGLHAHARQLIAGATGVPAPGADPWSSFDARAGTHRFAAGWVLAGTPVPATLATQKIGGANPPVLEKGKANGPIVQDLQGKLNVWREYQWRTQQGNPGYPAKYLPLSGKFDGDTAKALAAFQQAMGLKPTGVADVATQNLLILEGDPAYARDVSEANKMKVRELIASLGSDGARMAALAPLFDSVNFRTLDDHADEGRVIAALANGRADPAFAQSLTGLLERYEFRSLPPGERSAVLHYVSTHANAAMIANVERMLASSQDHGIMVGLAMRELAQHEARIAAREPGLALERNTTAGHLPTATGIIPQNLWSDPVALVGRLRQNGNTIDDVNARNRCGPANLLTAALLQGPEAAAKFLENVATRGGAQLTASEKGELKLIASQLRARNASFEDLSFAQDLAYRAADSRMGIGQWVQKNMSITATPPAVQGLNGAEASKLATLVSKLTTVNAAELREMSRLISKSLGYTVTATLVDDNVVGRKVMLNYPSAAAALRNGMAPGAFDDGELLALATGGGKRAAPVAYDFNARDPLGSVLARLKPGESAVLPLSGTATGTKADHYISVGILKDGRPYIYNPDPANGDATLTVGRSSGQQPQVFTDALNEYNKRANNVAAQHRNRRAISVAN